MYKQSDIADIRAQLIKRILAWAIPALVLIGLVVFSFARRMEWLSSLSFALLACMALFALGLYILPLFRYKRFLTLALNGRQRMSVMLLKFLDAEKVIRDGVLFIPLTFSAGSFQDEMADRQMYWDANLPLPPWNVGDRLRLFSHEKAITRWEPADAGEALNG